LSFPKGSEDFEKWNLLQSLSKIDCNGIYGVLGMYTSMLFNINVATSITSQGRALISSASLFFEGFLANNVDFGSLDEVLEFINNISKKNRKYNDYDILSHNISVEDCFSRLILSCKYRWVPDEEEMEIIWKVVNNLPQTIINRVYYKNNLYEFMNNSTAKDLYILIMQKMKSPFFSATENISKNHPEIEDELILLTDLMREYVFYNHMWIDRIDRCDNMIKSVIMVSDTDSCIVSFDAWYRWGFDVIKGHKLNILDYDPINIFKWVEKDDFGDTINKEVLRPYSVIEKSEEYDFENDEIIMRDHAIDPFTIMPQDYLRYSIMNIISYVVGHLVNEYMDKFTKNANSWSEDRVNKINMKNEFTFLRLLIRPDAKKNYASYMTVQEGNMVPESERLDTKGIECLTKSTSPISNRKALKKILLNDILTADKIDQYKIIEHLAIQEHKIIDSIMKGSKEYYKPATIKNMNTYDNPMRVQGIKASYVWNSIKTADLPAIDLNERNAISVAKVDLNVKNMDIKLKDKYPEVYEKVKSIIDTEYFKGKINSIAIPLDVQPPKWLLDIIDYNTIVNNNIGGFVYDSVGLVNIGTINTNFSNILKLG